MSNKDSFFKWAVIMLKEAVEENHFGTLTFNMQNGFIEKLEKKSYARPPVDEDKKIE